MRFPPVLRVMISAASVGVFTANIMASGLDHDGFRNDMTCDTLEVVTGSVVRVDKQKSTGKRASNDRWDMEIYEDDAGDWTLMGVNKRPKDKYEQACVLMSGSARRPYRSQAFYIKFFSKGGLGK